MSDSRVVRVDLDTHAVYPETGNRTRQRCIGVVQEYVRNEGARTPSGGKFISRRVTVKLRDDDRRWVGQFRADETSWIKIRPLEESK